jgi:hypothetical protein
MPCQDGRIASPVERFGEHVSARLDRRRSTFPETALVGDFAARFGGFWYFFDPGFFRYWFWFALMLAGLGLLSLSWSILKRSEFHVNFVR